MATLTVQEVTRAGTTLTAAAAAGGGDKFLPSDRTWYRVINGGGGAITVTFVTPGSVISDVPVSDVAVSVGAGVTKDIGPFPADLFANPSDGLCDVTYSGVTTVTVAAVKLKAS